jgi:hypothetical protein
VVLEPIYAFFLDKKSPPPPSQFLQLLEHTKLTNIKINQKVTKRTELSYVIITKGVIQISYVIITIAIP